MAEADAARGDEAEVETDAAAGAKALLVFAMAMVKVEAGGGVEERPEDDGGEGDVQGEVDGRAEKVNKMVKVSMAQAKRWPSRRW